MPCSFPGPAVRAMGRPGRGERAQQDHGRVVR
jgi:hypothetical protein